MIDLNINAELKNRTAEYCSGIVSHVEKRQPFIIWHTKEEYVRVNPASFAMVGYDKQGEHYFQCSSRDEFMVRLKLFILTHENFHSCVPQIEQDAYRQLSDKIKTLEE